MIRSRLRFGLVSAASVLTATALLTPGCRAFDESLLEDARPDGGASCPLHLPPPRSADADDGDDGETYFFALRRILLDQRPDRWASIGYDLDGLCTTEESPAVECLPPSPSAPPELDGPNGTDNVLGHQVLALIVEGMEGLEAELQSYQDAGAGCALVQIRGWNGEDDDPRVEAIISQSVFATSRRPDRIDSHSIVGAELRINGELYPPPRWDGADFWYADAANYLGGDPERPRTRDDNAYIAGRTLVMRIPDRYPISFRDDVRSAQFLLSGSVFTAKISPDTMSIEEATLAGRFGIDDALLTIPLAGFCQGSREYRAFDQLLDLAADIRLVPGTGGPTATCDALSVGLYYQQGSRAELGGIVVPNPLSNPCVDGGVPDGGVDAGPTDGGLDGGVLIDASAGADGG